VARRRGARTSSGVTVTGYPKIKQVFAVNSLFTEETIVHDPI
jgi:hypothetical protein